MYAPVLVYKEPSIYKQTNLTKWGYVKIEIQMLITSRNPKQGKRNHIKSRHHQKKSL